MSFLSGLKAGLSAVVAGAKACVGIPTVKVDEVLPADALAYEQEFFVHEQAVRDAERVLPTLDNASWERTTTASRREAQRKLDAERMVHVSVPVTMEDKLAVSWFGLRTWNNRIRAEGNTYYKSVVL